MREGKINVQLGGSMGSLLTIVLVVLKATGYLDWSWFLVFFPLWVPIVILVGFLGLAFFLALIGAILKQ